MRRAASQAYRQMAKPWVPARQSSSRSWAQRRPSLEERGETSTRFRSTTVEKGPAPDAARRGEAGALRRCYNAVTMCDNTPRSRAVNYLGPRKSPRRSPRACIALRRSRGSRGGR
jgi:hypothetical protein